MSQFLAPIHQNMYNKIKNQDEINKDLLKTFGDEKMEEEIFSVTGMLSPGKLEEIIDLNNIHGWLQNQIDIVEKAFSLIVQRVMLKGTTKEELINWFENRGESLSQVDTGEEIFRVFSNSFLDGMPCDRAIQPIELEENSAKWIQNIDVHGKYWEDGGELYNELRCAWIKGLAQNSEFEFKYNEGTYEVIK